MRVPGMQELLDDKFLDDGVYNVLLDMLVQCGERGNLGQHVEHTVLPWGPRTLYVSWGLMQVCRVYMIQQCEQ